MTPSLVHLWRHPIKGIGSEALTSTELQAGQPMPGDRAWALAHAKAEGHDNWQPRRNFLVVASGPNLAPVTAQTLEDGQIRLSHPNADALQFDPATEDQKLIDWVTPFWPAERPAPVRLVKSPPEGMADNGMAQVSIMSLSSLRALSQRAGRPLDPRRFRGNLWLDGLAPWEEFDLIDRTISIGPVRLRVTDRIERCRATEANPDTGRRDVDPPRALRDGWGHVDFGVTATVETDGVVHLGDPVGLG
jgi:uncharacterized protein YcbX